MVAIIFPFPFVFLLAVGIIASTISMSETNELSQYRQCICPHEMVNTGVLGTGRKLPLLTSLLPLPPPVGLDCFTFNPTRSGSEGGHCVTNLA